MCLELNRTQCSSDFKRPKGPVKVYKILFVTPQGENSQGESIWFAKSINFNYQWNLVPNAVFQSSRPDTNQTRTERAFFEIEQGFHVYVIESEAKSQMHADYFLNHDYKVVEFEGAPEDWVGEGNNPDMTNGAVFTKLKFLRVLNEF